MDSGKNGHKGFLGWGYRWFESLVIPGQEDGVGKLYKIFICALSVIIVVMTIDLVVVFKTEKFEHGVFGDFFGGVVNPILTFFTFMGLLITITIQRIELKESRVELAKSAEALQQQSEYFRMQNSVAAFYKMIDTHMAALDSMKYTNSDGSVIGGRDYVRWFLDMLRRDFKSFDYMSNNSAVDYLRAAQFGPGCPQTVGAAFDSVWRLDGEQVQPYLAGVRLVLSYVDAFLGGDELYVDMYGSLLSDSEKVLIFYYAIVRGDAEFKELLVRHAFLKNIPPDKLLDVSHSLGLHIMSL